MTRHDVKINSKKNLPTPFLIFSPAATESTNIFYASLEKSTRICTRFRLFLRRQI